MAWSWSFVVAGALSGAAVVGACDSPPPSSGAGTVATHPTGEGADASGGRDAIVGSSSDVGASADSGGSGGRDVIGTGVGSDDTGTGGTGGTGGVGSFNCQHVYSCVAGCAASDAACASHCVDSGTATAQAQYQDVASCRQERGCSDDACVQASCGAELTACGFPASTGGTGGTGGNTGGTGGTGGSSGLECRACADDSDCGDGVTAGCWLPDANGDAAFCALDCTDSGSCPSGSTCEPDGGDAYSTCICIPSSGSCEGGTTGGPAGPAARVASSAAVHERRHLRRWPSAGRWLPDANGDLKPSAPSTAPTPVRARAASTACPTPATPTEPASPRAAPATAGRPGNRRSGGTGGTATGTQCRCARATPPAATA
ncbi:MAG: hypothetical protein U1F43_37705 [Myxococcota bacterium]